jgi:hypothetical protein
MKFQTTMRDDNGNALDISITLDEAFAYLLAELESVGPSIASDNPQLAARITGEVVNACVKAGKKFALQKVLHEVERMALLQQTKEVVN